ncbi:hypothetical protein [uncultured Jannaschia sp.]|uniref:hypothetical protein n=1 Tax=uncultured Jannaschia sp. TaxID=293347 RepID=UPI002605C1F8|nr:hypothetical protein [uncultured Jannaschia sp.]
MSRASEDPETLNGMISRAAQLEAQVDAKDARVAVVAKREEDRLTWHLGRLLRDGMETDPELRAWVRRELPTRLTERDRQRNLWARLFPGESTVSSDKTAETAR